MSIVVPAVLPASEREFEERLARLARVSGVEHIQIDVVDGRFASPASWPCNAPYEFAALSQRGFMLPELSRITYEIDLMCYDPLKLADAWLAIGATRLTFHAESVMDLARLLAEARERYGTEVTCGVALNIASAHTLLTPLLDSIDYVQLMGIAQIGKQGQPFDERVYEKLLVFHKRHPTVPAQIDGGVSLANAKKLLAFGATSLVVGSALDKGDLSAEIAKFDALESLFGV